MMLVYVGDTEDYPVLEVWAEEDCDHWNWNPEYAMDVPEALVKEWRRAKAAWEAAQTAVAQYLLRTGQASSAIAYYFDEGTA